MTDVLRISHYIAKTKVLGPGTRYVIWFQGCKKRCKGCINPEGQTLEGGFAMTVDQLLDKIMRESDINGVTISGGEPFLQFEGLDRLVTEIKEKTKYDIMLYSGYQLQEIISKIGRERAENFFAKIDIFIDGEYQIELDTGTLYRGSTNQNIYLRKNMLLTGNKFVRQRTGILNLT